MADLNDIKNWAARRRSAGGGMGGPGVPQTGAGGGPGAGAGNDPPTGSDTIPGDGGEDAEQHHSLDDGAKFLRELANDLRQMDEVDGVDFSDLATSAEELADELEDASTKAEDAEPDDEEPDGDEPPGDAG